MSIYIELLLVTAVVVYIVALSGWTQAWLGWLSKFTAKHGYGQVRQLRPFSCSQCMTWWCCLLWALIRGRLSLPLVAYSGALAFFSITVENILIFIREGSLWCLHKLNSLWMQND